MAVYAILVEFDLSEDGPSFEEAAVPLLEALRTLAPVRPANITAFTGDVAERVINVVHGEGTADAD